MHILVFDHDEGSKEFCDIQATLHRRFTTSDDLVTAARYRRLIEICEGLEHDGPPVEVIGSLINSELTLTSNESSVKLWTDWFDYSRPVDGLPPLHWRIETWNRDERGSRLRNEARCDSTEDAVRIVLNELGFSS